MGSVKDKLSYIRVSVSGDFKSTFNLHIKQVPPSEPIQSCLIWRDRKSDLVSCLIPDVKVAVEDAGNYMCQVNTDPMTFQTAHMAVMVPPDIDMTRTSGGKWHLISMEP